MHNPIDYFSSREFSVQALTDAINVVPNRYGRLNELNVFPVKGIRTTYVQIEYKNGVLNLVPMKERGDPATKNKRGSRNMRVFSTFHLPLEDAILASDLQNVREFGTENQLAGVMERTNETLEDLRAKHAQTLEYLRWGALKGDILDEGGNSVLNLFTEFGITQKVVDFALGTDATDVDAKIMEVVRHIEDNLLGEMMTSVHAMVDSSFFDKLVSHPNIKEAYKYYSSVAEPLREDVRRRFVHKGMVFEEHRGSATALNEDGSTITRKFLAADDGIAFPRGTANAFSTYFAPADFMETVNTLGQEVYAKQERMKYNKGVEIYTESNPLPICKRPAVLVRIHSSN